MAATTYSPLFGEFPVNTVGYASRQARSATADAIIGAAPGVAVSVDRTRVKHSDNQTARDGGKVDLEVVSEINRNTTAADEAFFEARAKPLNAGSFSFPRDLSGNGGTAFTRSVS